MNTERPSYYKEPTVDSDSGAIAPYVVKDFIKSRVDADIETFSEELEISISKEDVAKLAAMWDLKVFEIKNNISILRNDNMLIIRSHYRDNYSEIEIFGSYREVKEARSYFRNNFKGKVPTIKWVFNERGDCVKCGLNTDRLPVVEMYPFLNSDSLADYYDSFMKSSANILVLIGPPGTGKTSFIRGLMNHTNSDAVVSYDTGVLQNDNLFASFMSNTDEYSWFDDDPTQGESFLVLEDADLLLSSRTDGNTIMHRFLNISDGIVSSPDKKLIFSTNLPSINDIDPALIRRGRCFDIVHFRPLDYQELNTLNNVFKLDRTFDKHEQLVISDYFN